MSLTPEQYKKLEEVFQKAVDIEPSELHAFLEEACRGDPALRSKAEELLVEDQSATSFLRRPFNARSLIATLVDDGVKADLTLDEGEDGSAGSPAVSGGDRYVVEKEIGRGGMGRVVLAYDRDFRRRIAMKMMLGRAEDRNRASRFLEEAQATAQLEHPNIAPVYDLGLNVTGNPFFTMKWIRGRDLDEILKSGSQEFTLIRLVQILQQVAMGVDFAHSRGVIHRDLKPENVMVGDYGEVLVMDWGVAKVIGKDQVDTQEGVTTDRREKGGHTLDGLIVGSPAFMAPEQALGDSQAIGPATDVFGLGSILYAVLTRSPVFQEASFEATLSKAQSGDVMPPRQRAPEAEIPPELEEICLKALARQPEDRFGSAREFHDRLLGFVEGIHDAERRAEEAGRLLSEAEELRLKLSKVETKEKELQDREKTLRAGIRDYDSNERKQPLWDLLTEAAATREEETHLFSETTAAYQAVLRIDPDNRTARGALADIFYQRMEEAEAGGDRESTGLYEGLVRQYHDGRYEEVLSGEVEVELESDPPGARVLLSRYEEVGIQLVESDRTDAGETPLKCRLRAGSYLAVLQKPGYSEVRYPFLLRRGRPLQGKIHLCRQGVTAEGFVQIPAGESTVGGDAALLSALPRASREVGEFFVSRFPVTLGEYCAFLNDTVAKDPSYESEEKLADLIPSFGIQKYVVKNDAGLFQPASEIGMDARALENNHPVMAIPHSAMAEYCRWLSRALGQNVRLLTELEWERCARGADGRLYPWGNGFDWSFCKGGRSRPGAFWPEPVGVFQNDCSPFGVRDLAGGVRELCSGWVDNRLRPGRGGSWYQLNPFTFRADFRSMWARGPGVEPKSTDVGFRVAYSLEER